MKSNPAWNSILSAFKTHHILTILLAMELAAMILKSLNSLLTPFSVTLFIAALLKCKKKRKMEFQPSNLGYTHKTLKFVFIYRVNAGNK